MNELTQNSAPTAESVWAQFQELGRLQKENEQLLNKNFAKTELLMKDTDRRMKELQKTVGGWANNHGSFAEEYFFNSFENGKRKFFGEKFNEIEKHLKPKNKNLKDEYDIVMYNGTSIAIVEVKYKAHQNDISKVLNKAETFKILCPDYKDYKIYLGLASMSFYPELEQECIDQGIAIIKQVGDFVVITDAHLKVF
jgi:hypothetical protein